MPNAMIEKVAKALCILRWGDDTNWNSYTDYAKAAIAAMREPTDEMLKHIDSVMLYQAMIDAALKE